MNRYHPEIQDIPPTGIIPSRVAELAELDITFENVLVRRGGWKKIPVYIQKGNLPVHAYTNTDDAIEVMGMGVIHGSEGIGGIAWAANAQKLIDLNRPTLLLPLLNPWGFIRRERYSPNGLSVGDTDEFFGVSFSPPTPESAHLIRFLIQQKLTHTRVLDIHEDGLWEDSLEGLTGPSRRVALDHIHRGQNHQNGNSRTYIDSDISYLYAASQDDGNHPLVTRISEILQNNDNPLPRHAHTRFPGETVVDGVVWNPQDQSIDHLLAFLGASVITTEITRRTPHDPPLPYRLRLQNLMIDAFLGID